MFRFSWFLVVVILSACSPVWGQPNEATLRIWTDSTGKHKLEASFVGLENQNVVLKKKDGKVIRVPLARLSTKDQ